MPAKPINNFEPITEHPHRTMHVLLSVLAFVLVVGSVVLYQTQRVKEDVVILPDEGGPVMAREKMIAQFREETAKIPPLTAEQELQRKKMIDDFKREVANKK